MSAHPRYALLVLLGPPGSGKSHLGRMLDAEGVARYTEMEPKLMARFGTGEAFAANKSEALQFLERIYEEALAVGSSPLAIETTGLSERPMLDRLAATYSTAFIRLDIDRETCLSRIAARADGRNLNNDPKSLASFHDFWVEKIAPTYRCDLVVCTDDAAAALTAIADLLI